MNLFVVAVVADPARTPAVVRAILDAQRRTSPFGDLEPATTTWTGRHTVAASFSIHAPHTAVGAYTHTTDDTFDTFSGLPRLQRLAGTGDWATALSRARDDGKLTTSELGGVWSLARATQDEVDVETSLTGSEPVLIARRPGLVVLGNRASLVRLATWPEFPIAYDTDALTTMCARGWLAHDRIPFSGLELLAPGSKAHITPDRVALRIVHRLDETEADPSTGNGGVQTVAEGGSGEGHGPVRGELAQVYDQIAEEMVDAAREVGRMGPPPQVEMAGDVNTRLSAAVYAAAGVDATFVTAADPNDPHTKIAAEIADLVGVEHVTAPVTPVNDDLAAQLTLQVRQGEGTSNVFDPCPPVQATPTIEVVRHAAGALLGGYDNLASGPRPAVTTIDEGRAFLDDLALHNGSLLLRDEARTTQQQINRRTAEELLDDVGRLSFHELAYLRLREGRGTGANRQAAGYGAWQFAPMLDDRVLRHLAAVPLAHKRSQRAAFELVHRLAPELAKVRFVGRRWRFEADGAARFFDPDGWAEREPLKGAATPNSHRGWRTRPDGSLLPLLVRRLAEPDALLDELIDRRRVQAALQKPAPVKVADLRSLFGALTAKQLLSGAWLLDGRRKRRSAA